MTTTCPALCVGRHAAMGECFYGVAAATRSQLHVGECVFVVFGAPDARGRYRLKRIRSVMAKTHRSDSAPQGSFDDEPQNAV